MRKLLVGIFVMCMLLLAAAPSQAASWQDYFCFGVGYNDFFNFNFARRYTDWGFEIGLGSRDYPDVLDYPCPHSGYVIVEDKYFSGLFGVDLNRYLDFADSLTIYLGVGGYYLEYDKITRSTATGWYYENSTSGEFSVSFSGGLQYHSGDTSGMGIGYHSLRGVNAYILFGF